MNIIRDIFINNDWVLFITVIFALIGFPFAIFTYLKSKSKKEITYDIFTSQIITNSKNKYDGLSIKYKDEMIPNFSASKFLFWNSGNDIINGIDVSEIDALRLNIKNGSILDHSIIQSMNDTNRVEIIKEGKDLQIKFDYIGVNEGMILEVLHSALESKEIEMKGTIKGHGYPIRNKYKTHGALRVIDRFFEWTIGRVLNSKIFKSILSPLLLILSIFMFVFSFLIYKENIIAGIVLASISMVYLLIGIIGLQRRVPRKFNRFMEDINL